MTSNIKTGSSGMQVLYAHEKLKKPVTQSIFLAGPSPRGKEQYNWRPEALRLLRDIGFEGTVFIPLPRNGQWSRDYDGQIEWELKHLEMASIIVFWIPRDLEALPAFTTNVEFGLYVKSGKIVLGFPEGTPKMRYLEYVGKKNNVSVYHTIEETLRSAIEILSNSSP